MSEYIEVHSGPIESREIIIKTSVGSVLSVVKNMLKSLLEEEKD